MGFTNGRWCEQRVQGFSRHFGAQRPPRRICVRPACSARAQPASPRDTGARVCVHMRVCVCARSQSPGQGSVWLPRPRVWVQLLQRILGLELRVQAPGEMEDSDLEPPPHSHF